MSAHASGPWIVDPYASGYLFVKDMEERTVAMILPGEFDRQTTEANARLIAAAPRLAGMLGACIEYLPDRIAATALKMLSEIVK